MIAGETVVVVGGAGFVGSRLVRALLERDAGEIVVIDNLLSSDARSLPKDSRINFVLGSINDPAVLKKIPAATKYLWHLACFHGNQSSIADPIRDHENSALSSIVLFDYLARTPNQIKSIVYAAAGCAVADKTNEQAIATVEESQVSLNQDSPYSISKLVGEMYANYYFKESGLPTIRARFQNVYGPGEMLGAGDWRGTVHTVWRNVVPTFIWKALHDDALTIFGDGSATRDFIFVDDIVRGLILCAEQGTPGDVYNLASGRETSIRELSEIVTSAVGKKVTIDAAEVRPWDRSGKRFGSVTKSKESLGFVAEVDLLDGVRRTVDWTRQNRDLIQSCIDRHSYFMSA